MKKLPIGIQTFSKLRDPEQNFVYVDKTDVLLRLVDSGEYYFLSRPRRFGKSVMLSTLYELFSGNRELFKDLYIEDKWDWDRKYPVIRISFGSGDFSTEEKFDDTIYDNLKSNMYRLDLDCEDAHGKPILDHITNKEKARENRDKLKGFYSIMKDMDEHIKFVMITGVSKFAKMNLFSGLNNLMDISINAKYATICGYTHKEVEKTFAEHLQGVDMAKLKDYYASVVYAYFASLGLQLIAEDTTNKGRVDMTIILPDKVYVIEFKVDQDGKALEQIKKKGYHEKYLTDGLEIYIVGINFDSEEKNINDFEWENISNKSHE